MTYKKPAEGKYAKSALPVTDLMDDYTSRPFNITVSGPPSDHSKFMYGMIDEYITQANVPVEYVYLSVDAFGEGTRRYMTGDELKDALEVQGYMTERPASTLPAPADTGAERPELADAAVMVTDDWQYAFSICHPRRFGKASERQADDVFTVAVRNGDQFETIRHIESAQFHDAMRKSGMLTTKPSTLDRVDPDDPERPQRR